MGNDNELTEIENKHDEELKRIIAMEDDNRRKREIEEMSVKYNYQLKDKELNNLVKRYADMHVENMKKIDNQHTENMKQLNDNFTLKNKELDYNQTQALEKINNEKIAIGNKHIEEMKRIDTDNQQKDNQHKEKMQESEQQFKITMEQMKGDNENKAKEREIEKINAEGNVKKEFEIIQANNNKELNMMEKEYKSKDKMMDQNHEEKMLAMKQNHELEKIKLQLMMTQMMNPNMMNNPMMMGAPMQFNPKSEQAETAAGPLPEGNKPLNKNLSNSMSQSQSQSQMNCNPTFGNPMASSAMFNPMMFQMMNMRMPFFNNSNF